MSVIVKDMKMPQKCYECDFEYDIYHCPLIHEDTDEVRSTKRLDGCPLVELPEKHGRLGDLDELWERMLNYTDNDGAIFPYGDDDSLIHRDSACFMIESADTIIEAEGTES